MKKLHVKATFIEPVLGTWPANPNVAREFIASKSPDATTIEDEVAALGPDAVADKGTTVAASGNEVIRWSTVHKYLPEFGVATSCNLKKTGGEMKGSGPISEALTMPAQKKHTNKGRL